MDYSLLAGSILPYITDALPYLISTGTEVSESIHKTLVDKLGHGMVDGVCKLWSRIKDRDSAKKAAERVATDPKDQDNQSALKVEIKDLLRADSSFASELKQILAGIGPKVGGNVVTALGTGAVAVVGNVKGNITTNVNKHGD
jgi:hypothetical protein